LGFAAAKVAEARWPDAWAISPPSSPRSSPQLLSRPPKSSAVWLMHCAG